MEIGKSIKKILSGKSSVKGFLDRVSHLYAFGWAWNPDKPEERLTVVIYADGKPVAEGIADQFRGDLLKAGIGDGRYGFVIKLPEELADGKEHEIKAKVKGVDLFLKNEFKVKLINYTIPNLNNLKVDFKPRGAIESFKNGTFIGWVFLPNQAFENVQVEVYVKDYLIGETTTGIYREDLSKIIGFPIKPGFEFKIDQIESSMIEKVIDILSKSSFNEENLIAFKLKGMDFQVRPLFDFKDTIPQIIGFLTIKLIRVYQRGRVIDVIERGIEEEPFIKKPEDEEVKIIAFYLPQYHPFPENNDWWGPGFTEWTHVSTAKPYFKGHYQPRIPADLGFYDLRLEEVQLKQIELAKKYGISGFCYHYYWFSGKKLMNFAIERHFKNGYDFDFCICWANENWSRRWDGSDQEVLIAQEDSEGDAMAFIKEVSKFFESPRYIKINGAPFIIIYNLKLFSSPEKVIKQWKEYVKSLGFPDLHVCMVETFGQDNTSFICDSACQFPPHKVVSRLINSEIEDLPENFKGNIYDYEEVVYNEIALPDSPYPLFRTVMAGWDNTPRRKESGTVFHRFSPELFEAWLTFSILKTKKDFPPGMRYVFINAWNGWGEGTYLEPDRKYGHRLLKAVKNALSISNQSLIETMLEALASEDKERLFDYITTLRNSSEVLLKMLTSFYRPKVDHYISTFIPFDDLPDVTIDFLKYKQGENKTYFIIESINGKSPSIKIHIMDRYNNVLYLKGWQHVKGVVLLEYTPTFVVLLKGDKPCYFAQIYERYKIEDVISTLGTKSDIYHGFTFVGELKRVEPGKYRLASALPTSSRKYALVITDYTLYVG